MTSLKDFDFEHAYDFDYSFYGWVKTFRSNKFIMLNDGSTLKDLQIFVDYNKFDKNLLKKITTGAAIKVVGKVVKSPNQKDFEISASLIEVLGESDPTLYPIQPKKHSLKFLQEQGHLRFRTKTFGAIFRVRHHLSFAIHSFFNQNSYFYLNTPIITGSDAEGAGEMFKVTALDLKSISKPVVFEEDFFGQAANLTVSGQLEAELAAMGLGKVYTFGPTFRAENSNTTRHLSEFWMIEPETAFCDLKDNIHLAKGLLKYCITYVLDKAKDDLEFLTDREVSEELELPLEERHSVKLIDRLKNVLHSDFPIISYTDAINILKGSKVEFKYPVDWGLNLQSEHERFLVEKYFNEPIIVKDYPETIKAFYMRRNDDLNTVAAMDILFPGIGEIIGGSQREERLSVLIDKCSMFNVSQKELWWYLETRKFGSCFHSGFGLGLERLMMFITGMKNIRDVVPFPRAPNEIKF